MVRAEVLWWCLASRRSIEHPAQRHAIHDAAVHAKSDDSTRALVHHDENPDRPQYRGFASKQIETPQTVLRMTEKREPGRPIRVWVRLVPRGENAPNNVLVDGYAECQGNLLRDPWTKPHAGFRCFIWTTAAITSWLGPFGPGFWRTVGENSS